MKELKKGKCFNAAYCKYSNDGVYCDADDEKTKDCTYLEAINQVALLSMESTKTHDKQNHTPDKKYVLEKIEELGKHNEFYDDIEGKICYLAYFKVGERGWFLYESDGLESWFLAAHRIHTSIVKSVEYVNDKVLVETQNTKFVFKMITW